MKYFITVLLVSMTTTMLSNVPSYALFETPVPYSEEAFERLSRAKYKAPAMEPGMTPEQKTKAYVDSIRKFFSNAGYSYDKTVVKVIKDLKKEPEFFKNNIHAGLILTFVSEITKPAAAVAEANNVSLEKLFSKEVALAVKELGIEIPKKEKMEREERERKQQLEADEKKIAQEEKQKIDADARQREEDKAQRKKQEEALIIKQERLARLAGYYETQHGNEKLEIQVVSEDNIKFSVQQKKGVMAPCKIEDKTAKLEYSDYYGFIAKFAENDCELTMTFMKDVPKDRNYAVRIDQNKRCRSYCGAGGNILGWFHKK
ncbi:MAG: hypothetical protein HY035_00815 [Nitrospirae bacterium]|nr:hypothetical protein [Nitrospirota bacterium]MBI3376931.1 hypothetical protein [Nitrospirota bacterium]